MSKQIFQKYDVEFRKKVIVPTPEEDDEAVNKAYTGSLVSVSGTASQEFTILRQRDDKPDEFAEYNEYFERCKAEVKRIYKL